MDEDKLRLIMINKIDLNHSGENEVKLTVVSLIDTSLM